MKRILALLLVIVLFSCSLVSCLRRADSVDGQGSITQHVHIFEKANCKSPKLCECGATEGKPLNKHSFENGVCVDCEKRLVVELARLATDPVTDQPRDGFYISREDDGTVKYITVRADIVDKALSEKGIYAYVAIKMDQDAITTGVYEWAIVRSTYLPEADNYERVSLYGILNADDFLDPSALEVVENEGFSEDEVLKYKIYIPTCVDRMVNQIIMPALKNNPSGITVNDIGFVNYGEATTKK